MSDAQIRVTIPSESRFVALGRVTVASLAAEMDFTIDDVEDLTVGANELVALLVDAAEEAGVATVDLEYRMIGDVLELRGVVPGVDESAVAPADPLAEKILAAVVDEYELGPGSGRIAKRRSA